MNTTTATIPASMAFAQKLFTRGTDCIGPQEVKQAGLTVDFAHVPPMPFSQEDLSRARELGQFLILHTPTTMRQLCDRLENKLGDGKLLYDTDWYRGEVFYTTEPVKPEWKLVSREVIPGSTGQNYLGQTQAIADYIRGQVYEDMELPASYQAAIAELKDRKGELEKLVRKDWKQGAEALANLQLNQLFRGTPADTLFDIVAYFKVNGEYLLSGKYHWSSSRSSVGILVYLGPGDPGGVDVDVLGRGPGCSLDCLGVVFSRSAAPTSGS